MLCIHLVDHVPRDADDPLTAGEVLHQIRFNWIGAGNVMDQHPNRATVIRANLLPLGL